MYYIYLWFHYTDIPSITYYICLVLSSWQLTTYISSCTLLDLPLYSHCGIWIYTLIKVYFLLRSISDKIVLLSISWQVNSSQISETVPFLYLVNVWVNVSSMSTFLCQFYTFKVASFHIFFWFFCSSAPTWSFSFIP